MGNGLVQVPAGLVVLVGPPAAGKSTFVQELIKLGKIPREAVASSDAIRAELIRGKASSGTPPVDHVVSERDRLLLTRLSSKLIAVSDSTNVTAQGRGRLIHLARRYAAAVTMLRFDQEEKVLLQQNEERPRDDVPDSVVCALATRMTHEARTAQLYAEGAAFVHDVPGRGQGFTATAAARLFTFAHPWQNEVWPV